MGSPKQWILDGSVNSMILSSVYDCFDLITCDSNGTPIEADREVIGIDGEGVIDGTECKIRNLGPGNVILRHGIGGTKTQMFQPLNQDLIRPNDGAIRWYTRCSSGPLIADGNGGFVLPGNDGDGWRHGED